MKGEAMKKFSLAALLENKYAKILIAMAKTIAASFLPYLFIAYTIAAGTDEVWSKSVTDFLACLLVAILFCYFFHVFYTHERNKEYAIALDTTLPFDTKKELLSFFKSDGVPLLKIYGVLAVFQWILSSLFFFWQIRTPVSVILWFIFPFRSPYNVTLLQYLSTLLSPLFTLLSIFPVFLLLAVRHRKKLYKKYK